MVVAASARDAASHGGEFGEGGGAVRPAMSAGAFTALAVISFGGPLALAALYAPSLIDDMPGSAGVIAVAGAVIFALPLSIWLRYSKDVASSGGLFSFVEAAAGRRLALTQAAIWTISYLLYLVYTTAYVVYDILPVALPGVRPYRGILEVATPVLLAGVVLAGRTSVTAALYGLAIGQVGLAAVLGVTSIAHAHPASSFTTVSDVGGVATTSAETALLFVCGSLPLFFGGEIKRPHATMRRGVVSGYVLTAILVAACIFPLAANPAFVHAEIPGMSVASVYLGHGAGVAIGVGVAASVVGVMLVEYLALTRLLHAVRGINVRRAAKIIAVPLVVAGPLSLLNPQRFYDDLLKPSLVALWVSQLIAVAVFPLFLRRRGQLRWPAVLLTAAASAVMVFGLYSTLHNGAAT